MLFRHFPIVPNYIVPSPSSKAQNFYHFVNQFVKKVEEFLEISQQSLYSIMGEMVYLFRLG